MQADFATPFTTVPTTVRPRVWVAGLVLSSLMASVGLAQQAAKPDLKTIRATELTGIDRNNVQSWATAQVKQLLAVTDDKTAVEQGRAFFQAVYESVKAANATAKFKEGLGTILADAFVTQYKSAPATRRPLATMYVVMTLRQTAQPNQKTIDALSLALSDPAATARFAALEGLFVVRDQLTAQQWASLGPILQKAGTAEQNPPTLLQIYKVLMVSQATQATANVPVVMAILEARLDEFDKKKGWPQTADADAVKWLGERLATITNAQQQQRIIRIMARQLTHAVYAFVGKPGEDHQERLERVILKTEEQLKTAVSRRAPGADVGNVKDAMLDTSPTQVTNMLAALHKWIGTAQTPGVLNKPPFGFEAGLKITPPAVASKPAAEANAK